MSSVVAVQTNTVTFAPGTIARQREAAVSELNNFIPVGTYLSAAFGTEKQYLLDFLQEPYELTRAVLLNGFLIIDMRVYLATEYGMEFLFRVTQYARDDTAVWSSTFVEGEYWLCFGGHAVWRINAQLRTVEDVTESLPYVPLYLESSGLRLILGTNDTVSWSSQTDRLDFTTVGSGAGSQAINVLGAMGTLQALGKSPDGFIVYTTRGILVAANTDYADIPFSFQTSILPGYVLTGPYAQTSLASYQPVAVFKGRGLCKISISNDTTATAVVELINPFIGQADGINGETIRAFPFFGGYVAFDTDSTVYFMDVSGQTFGMLNKTHWLLLIPNTSYAIDMSGRVFRLSMKDNTVSEGVKDLMVEPENTVWCDGGNLENARLVELYSGQTPDIVQPEAAAEGMIEQYVLNVDFNSAGLARNAPDGFDCMVPSKEPLWGEDYQKQWEEIGNILPRKHDSHEDIDVTGEFDLMPPEDFDKNAAWDVQEFSQVCDSVTITYGSTEDPVQYDLPTSATFTGIRANESDANLHTRCNSVVLYEYQGTDDTLIDCNAEDGEYDCNTMADEIWDQIEGTEVTVTVNNKNFVHQKDNLFTGHTRDKNHTITVRGARVLSEVRATLLGGGIK